MKDFFQRPEVRLTIFVFFLLLTRFPFLYDGFGLDSDSWSVAITAKNMAAGGHYEASRFPGYPVQEFVCSWFYTKHPFSLNFLTALISTIGFLYFALILKTLHFKRPFLATAAFAFVPSVYIDSTTSIDYMWALAFILMAMYYVLRHKPILAGLLLGLAIGCRLTSGAMLIPLSIMMIRGAGMRGNVEKILKLSLATLITGAIMFLPVYLKYGWSFLTFYDAPYPTIPTVLYKLSFGVWGFFGVIAILVSILLLFLTTTKHTHKYLFPRSVNEKHIIAWLIAIDLYIIAYLRLPMEAGYLIPIVPFVIMIFGKYLHDKAFTFFAITLIISSFFCGISPAERSDASPPMPLSLEFKVSGEKLNLDVLKGPVFSYQSRREMGNWFTNKIVQSLDTVKQKSLIVSGKWYNQIYWNSNESNNAVALRDYVSQDTLLYFIGKGYTIYYLPQQEYFNQLMRNYDIKLFGAEPYVKE